MKHWINKNYKTLIITAFLIPIITVAIVSISHVTKWYGISNPVSWSLYLSVGIEIAALSALAAISANMGKKVYFPFIVVTLVQFIGNIFFAYSFIDINSKSFKDWVDLVSPLVSFMGVEATDYVGHKRFLALFAGGMLPIISLSFLHMLVKFTEEDRLNEVADENKLNTIQDNVPNADVTDEMLRAKLSERDLEILEHYLLNPNPPNEALINAAEKYKETVKVEAQQEEVESIIEEEPVEEPIVNHVIEEPIEETFTPDEEVLPTEEEEMINFNQTAIEEEPIQEEVEISEVFIDEPEEIPVVEPEPEAPKFNMDVPVEQEEFKEINNDSFWRDHVQDQNDDLKKKI